MADKTTYKPTVGLTDYPTKIAALIDALAEGADPFGRPGSIQNLSLAVTVAGNALTCNVKARDGGAPSANSPVKVAMRDATLSSGGFSERKITAALSLTISSGSTLGHVSAAAQWIYWYLIDNAGTLELAASSKYFGASGIVSTTAEGGAGAADSATAMYSAVARNDVPFRCVGRTLDTQAAAGTWTALPIQVDLWPFDAVDLVVGGGRKNAIINSAFNIWQRGASFAAVATGAYTADRFMYLNSSAAVHTISRSTDVPSVALAGRLFNYSCLIDCTTLAATIGAAEFAGIQQLIEGFNWLPLAQKTITLSFYVKATKTGTYCVALRNSGQDRSCVAEYAVNAANTCEKKVVTFPASPSAGTWDYTNGIGVYLSFALAVGSNYQTTPGVWQTGNFLGTANQVNACDSVSNDFLITGIQLEAGSVATEFENMRFSEEVAACQRYFEKSFALGTAPAQALTYAGAYAETQVLGASASQTGGQLRYCVRKRATPTVTFYNPRITNAQFDNGGIAATCSLSVAANGSDVGFNPSYTTAVGSIAGTSNYVQWTADAEL